MNFGRTLTIAALAVLASASYAQNYAYANVTTWNGNQYLANGSATDQSGNIITKLVADDIELHPLTGGFQITALTFSVVNANAAAVSVRARVRFWEDNGAGAPGTAIAGYTFNAFSFAANTNTLLSGNLGTGFTIPANHKMWAGITFDNNVGATGATQAQLNNFGMGLYNPPTVGVSGDNYWVSTNPGSNFSSNPLGAGVNGAAGLGSFGWRFETTQAVPEPGTMAVLGLGLAAIARRRKQG